MPRGKKSVISLIARCPGFKKISTDALGDVASMIGEQLINLAFKGQNKHGQVLRDREAKTEFTGAVFSPLVHASIEIDRHFR